MRPVIIGAGPIGCYTAMKLKSLNPIIFEDHKQVGLPCHCAGLINKRIDELVKLPSELVLNTVRGAKLFSKNKSVTIDSGKKTAYVIDRALFDKQLAKLSGAEIRLSEPIINYELTGSLMSVKTSKRELKTELLIDASGPRKPVKYAIGVQVRAKLKVDEDFVQIHFNSPGFFSWVIPEGDGVCRIGLGAKQDAVKNLNIFLKKIGAKKAIDKQAGVIPLSVEQFYSNNMIRIGDSAGQVKSTTGGGIITGLLSADYAASSVIKAYNDNNFTKSFFNNNYYKPWSKTVGRELRLHAMIRSLLNKFDDSGYDLLINFINDNKSVIQEHGDMDFPSKFLFKFLKFNNVVYALKFLSKTFKNR